jgi:mono/diheme cytochrome c family protein
VRLALIGLATLAAGCVADADAAPPVPGDPEPEEVACGPETPTVTWETFGEGFVTTHCQGCHASTALDRKGAPPALFFDTAVDVGDHVDLILDAATADPPRMPPAGGPSDEDRERLAVWLTCFPP